MSDYYHSTYTTICDDLMGVVETAVDILDMGDMADPCALRMDYCRLSDDGTVVSYLPLNRVERHSGYHNWRADGRQDIRFGRFLRKAWPNATDAQIEKLAALTAVSELPDYEIVTGEDIAYYYNTLHNQSCMAGKRESFFTLYTKNRAVSMLVIPRYDARALLWEVTTRDGGTVTYLDNMYFGSGGRYLDRVRAKLCEENGWDTSVPYDGYVQLDTIDCHAPYVDTFSWLCARTERLYTERGSDYDRINLHNTGGTDLDEYIVSCSGCGERGLTLDDDGRCSDCALARCEYCSDEVEDSSIRYCESCTRAACPTCGGAVQAETPWADAPICDDCARQEWDADHTVPEPRPTLGNHHHSQGVLFMLNDAIRGGSFIPYDPYNVTNPHYFRLAYVPSPR